MVPQILTRVLGHKGNDLTFQDAILPVRISIDVSLALTDLSCRDTSGTASRARIIRGFYTSMIRDGLCSGK